MPGPAETALISVGGMPANEDEILTKAEIRAIIRAAESAPESDLEAIVDELLGIKIGWLLFQAVVNGQVKPTWDATKRCIVYETRSK